MDLSFSKEDLAFRDEVRAFLAEKYDDDLRKKMAQSKNGYLDKAGQLKWQKALYERGWAAPHWPKEFGGPDWTANQKYVFDLEMSAAGTPIVSPMGLRMVAPVIMAFGSDAQRERFEGAVLVGIGGSLDVWSGASRRAPGWMRAMNLEWLYRISTEPWRIKRIYKTLPMFVVKVLLSK